MSVFSNFFCENLSAPSFPLLSLALSSSQKGYQKPHGARLTSQKERTTHNTDECLLQLLL
jgi:hypothetical protein